MYRLQYGVQTFHIYPENLLVMHLFQYILNLQNFTIFARLKVIHVFYLCKLKTVSINSIKSDVEIKSSHRLTMLAIVNNGLLNGSLISVTTEKRRTIISRY